MGLRHLDDFLVAGPPEETRAFLRAAADILLLDQIRFLEKPGDVLRLLGVDIVKEQGGFSLLTNPEIGKEALMLLNLTEVRATKISAERVSREEMEADDIELVGKH